MPASYVKFTTPLVSTSIQWTGENRADVEATFGDIADYGTAYLTDSNNTLFIWGERGMVVRAPVGSWIVSIPTWNSPPNSVRLPLEVFSDVDYQALFSPAA